METVTVWVVFWRRPAGGRVECAHYLEETEMAAKLKALSDCEAYHGHKIPAQAYKLAVKLPPQCPEKASSGASKPRKPIEEE